VEDTWSQLLELTEAGKGVRVNLAESTYVPRRTRKGKGRPRVRGATLFGHYAGYREDRGGRPKCARKGCGNYLRRDQRLGCSPQHEEEALAEARAVLAKVSL
jgi:hypothetical protein